MLLNVSLLVAGLALLAVSSDRFVTAAQAIAHIFGISPMVTGLTVVALGTSAPEMLVSITAAAEGAPALALGNVIGSNIANATLVAGGSALVLPLVVHSSTVRQEFPLLIAATALTGLLLIDGHLSRIDAAALMLATVLVILLIVRTAMRAARRDPLRREIEAQPPVIMHPMRAGAWLVFALLFMVGASRMIVIGATGIAVTFGVSELVIGLTIVALGTSLPELGAAIASVLKDQPDIALGNVLGSNLFNLLPVLAAAALVTPFDVEPIVLQRDYPIMAALTVMLLIMCMAWRSPGRVTRLEGGTLLVSFASYQALLYAMQL